MIAFDARTGIALVLGLSIFLSCALSPTEPGRSDTIEIISVSPPSGSDVGPDDPITIKYEMDVQVVQDSVPLGVYFGCSDVTNLFSEIDLISSSTTSGTVQFTFDQLQRCSYAVIAQKAQLECRLGVKTGENALAVSGQGFTLYLTE